MSVRRLWILRKIDDAWRISGLVDALGDTLQPVDPGPAPVSELVAFLQEEAQAWNSSRPKDIGGHFDKDFLGCDAYSTYRPETWKIIFNGTKEFSAFLARRLTATRYQMERQVLTTRLGAGKQVAVAVTHEQVRTSHKGGDVVHHLDRNVLWILDRRSGSWRVRTLCYRVALGD